jgi:hypothetical protein
LLPNHIPHSFLAGSGLRAPGKNLKIITKNSGKSQKNNGKLTLAL